MKPLATATAIVTAVAGLAFAGPALGQGSLGDPTGGMGIGTTEGPTGSGGASTIVRPEYGAGTRGGIGGNAGDIPDTGGVSGTRQGRDIGGGQYGRGAVGGMGGNAGDIPDSGAGGGGERATGNEGLIIDRDRDAYPGGAVGPAAAQPIQEFQWGWLGLFGLLGFFGLRRRDEAEEEVLTHRERRAA